MRKVYFFTILLSIMAMSVSGQLIVKPSGKVGIQTTLTNLNAKLTVGNGTNDNTASVGLLSAPTVQNMTNIGVEGVVMANSSYTSDKNYGVLGVVGLNSSHGRNYGASGVISLPNSYYGGTGVFGATSLVSISNPIDIQGIYAGYFAGPVNATGGITAPGMYTSADSRLSENIVSLGDRDVSGRETLENVLNMNVVEYNLKSRLNEVIPDDFDPEKAEYLKGSYQYLKKEDEEMVSRRHFGVDAEELQKLYPGLVLEGQDGYLCVNYSELVPLLIRSIQALKQELDALKGAGGSAKRVSQATDLQSATANSGNVLYQNSPNPFKEQTVIRFSLADDARDAAVCIFDMTGKTLKKIPVSVGMESVQVKGYELGDGIFLYSLVVNGQEIDTKRMILSK